jgi:S-adenosylmethionine:tRNA ribosyltransferase-isomerase
VPGDRRESSRLLVLDRDTGARTHTHFERIADYLPERCVLVRNDTRVLPARLFLRRRTGGRLEGLFLHEPRPGVWELMLTGAGRLKPGEEVTIEGSDRLLRMIERIDGGRWTAEPVPADDAYTILESCGHPPLPPYIRRPSTTSPGQEQQDRQPYQTVYAAQPGAVAAPTAGLHFTEALFAQLRERGIQIVDVTLHVGVGTFTPIRSEDLTDHVMHAEWYACSDETARIVNAARQGGRSIVAVGTTSVRVLESCADDTGRIEPSSGWTRLFIYPPYRFKAVEAMITNFHLPGSTLLAMVAALAGRENILAAYDEAVREAYRFYSYGDAMLIRSG